MGGAGRTSSERLIGGLTSPSSSYATAASHRVFSSLTSVRGRLFLPMVFVGICLLSVVLCLFVLEPDWTSHYSVGVRTFFYTLLATALLFTLTYLFITFWRLVKILGTALLCSTMCPWRSNGGSSSSGGGRNARFRHHLSDLDSPDLFDSLSLFASTSLLRSVAQIRIMSVCAMISGVYFGHMFGALDREDQTKRCVDRVYSGNDAWVCAVMCARWLVADSSLCLSLSLRSLALQPSRSVRPARELLLLSSRRFSWRHVILHQPVSGSLQSHTHGGSVAGRRGRPAESRTRRRHSG